MNKVTFIGRIAKDPEVRYTQGIEPLAICQFSIAVDRPYSKNRTEGEPTSDFFRCICFGKKGEAISKYFTKGHKIGIAGRLQTGSYTDRDGVKRYTTDIVVEDFEFCESKGNSENNAPPDNFIAPENIDDDLPFN